MYSFAVTAYEILAGCKPFRANSPNELLNKHLYEKPVSPETHNPDATKEFCDFILRMLAKKREDRPKDFHDVLITMRSLQMYKNAAPKPAAGG